MPNDSYYNVILPITLLRTKLFVPPLRPNLVPRPRLFQRLEGGILSVKLTMISAPAGCGPTTLLSEGVTANSRDLAGWQLAVPILLALLSKQIGRAGRCPLEADRAVRNQRH